MTIEAMAKNYHGFSLIELIYGKEWDEVKKHLKHHPEEASMQVVAGGNTTMALHEAVKCKPPLGVSGRTLALK